MLLILGSMLFNWVGFCSLFGRKRKGWGGWVLFFVSYSSNYMALKQGPGIVQYFRWVQVSVVVGDQNPLKSATLSVCCLFHTSIVLPECLCYAFSTVFKICHLIFQD